MAIMHPASIPPNKVNSEIRFFNACKEQLSDKFHVFYSVRWYTTNNGVREDSECDFLVFNPDYGFLCIEVKGGTGITVDGDHWYLHDNHGGRSLKKSPYTQAEDSMRFFKDYYEEELETTYSGVYGNAVAFPNFSVTAPLTVSSPLELTIDINDMPNLSKRITELFRYFRGRKAGQTSFLSPDSQKKFIQLIRRRVALSIAAGALIQDKEIELAGINQTQETVIDLLTHYSRAFIIGGAGTGKTWIGIKKITRCIYSGNQALYLCYNRALADYVKSIVADDRADCYNIDLLAYSILKEKANNAPVKNGCKEYSDLFVASALIKKYDLIVVDEAQDFTEDWAICANLLLNDTGSLYVLHDDSQNIFNRSFGSKFLIDEKPFVLRYNIRNTGNIYRYSQNQTALGLDTIANQIEGVEPDERTFKRKAQAVAFLDSTINKLINREAVSPEKIVILSNRKQDNSILSNVSHIGDFILSDSKDTQENTIAYRTIQGFKGLESDVVIFINHTYKNEPKTNETRAMLYTAYTRARFFLYVINYEDAGLA